MTTVDAQGTPLPSPVWFTWDGTSVLVYSEPDKPKLRNIQRNPRVALNFDGDGQGGNIVIIGGTATISEDMPPATQVPAYAKKYDAGGFYRRIGLSGEQFASRYSIPILISPANLRGH